MGERRRFLLLIFIMTAVALCASGLSLFALYQTAFEEKRIELLDIAKSQARMIEAMAHFNRNYVDEDIPGRLMARTIDEIADAHDSLRGFGRSGEFSLGKQERDEIVFLLKHRNLPAEHPEPLPISSLPDAPMRRALAGESGTLIGLDYRGERVLLAFEPVAVLNLGLVAKIDLQEIRAPFIRASWLAAAATMVLVVLGAAFFLRIGNPMLRRLHESEVRYRNIFDGSPNGVLLQGELVEDCNEQACNLCQLERAEIVGRPFAEILSADPETRSLIESHLAMALDGQPQSFQLAIQRQGTNSVDIDLLMKAVDVGERRIALIIMSDISERMHALDSLRERNVFIETIMDNLPIGLSVEAADNHKYLYANRKVEEILGWPRQELWLSLEHFWELLYPDPELRKYYFDKIYGDIKQGDASKMIWEVPIVKGNGDEATLLINGIPMLDKNLMIITLQDITERKRAEKLQAQLELAAEVQSKLLPHKELEVPGFEFAAWCQPAYHVGGDFYDWQRLASGAVSFTLGDVMGKGMPASMLMATVRATLRAVSQEHPPALALKLADQAIRQDLDRSDSFVTLFHAQLEVATRRLTFVDCGHGWVFCRRSNGQVDELSPRGLPLGVPSVDEYQEGGLVLNGGDALVLYSDGLVDAFPDEPPGAEFFATKIEGSTTAKEIVDRLVALVPKDNPLPDDLTILVVRCKE